MPTRPFRRRRLGRELAALREAANLTMEQAARATEIKSATISRIESGKAGSRMLTIRSLLDLYEVKGEKREALLELARNMNQPAYWHSYGDVLPEWFEVYVDLEAEASELAIFDAQFINGLFQTEDYARAMFLSFRPETPIEEVERQVELRMRRQERLRSGHLSVRTIIDECALQRPYGDRKVIRGQLEYLCDIARIRNVSMQILSSQSQANATGSFTILGFPEGDDPPVVYIEHEAGGLYLEKPNEIHAYSRAYDRLRAHALSPESSAAHITQLVKEM